MGLNDVIYGPSGHNPSDYDPESHWSKIFKKMEEGYYVDSKVLAKLGFACVGCHKEISDCLFTFYKLSSGHTVCNTCSKNDIYHNLLSSLNISYLKQEKDLFYELGIGRFLD